MDRKVNTADVIVSGLAEGAYYWLVQSYDVTGKESVESEKNRFTFIPRGKDAAAIHLELEPFVQHGHVIELLGKTEIGARVMVNGREVPVVGTDGSFHYFTPPLNPGESTDHRHCTERPRRSEHVTEKDCDPVARRVSGASLLGGKNFGVG